MTYLRTWPNGTPEAAPVLLCLPQAGASALQFQDWQRRLGSRAMVCAVQLPGREDRWGEPAPSGIAEVVGAVVAELADAGLLGRPLVVFGDSLGGLIAYEVARAVGPSALVVCVCRAPVHWARQGGLREDDVERLASASVAGSDLPPELAAELRDIAAEVLRRDAALSATFREVPGAEPLRCPVYAWGALADETVTPAQLDDWRAVTTGPLHRHDFDGGHRVSREDPGALLGRLSHVLADLAEEEPS
ncbi:thioesterase [Streptomyces hygroscopicus subsp. hygroscopicus]|uniref:thioesterase II family protein n=1 Tax=Streptomyces sp. KHY 26 TaxID=3097359 RepID=UPI0024A3227C|nr:thioesterase domain-containing protein [Streptomyces hygroscopicus]GLX47280.1 thioesterase [Streptomyces hygroscopicus subsp. hygroscopicus]